MTKQERRWPHGEGAPEYEKVNGKDFFRFSGRGDEIHFSTDNGMLCGKPGLSNNYARYKPKGIICRKCLKKAKETK